MMGKILGRWLGLLVLALLALQVFFLLRVLAMRWIDPQSTAFQRSEIWQLIAKPQTPAQWKQQWLPYAQISDHMKRAVIASEDGEFVEHDGIEWEAIEQAWERNSRAQQLAERRSQRVGKAISPKIVGGSTISQQLAKNLFLSGERNLLRKGQELLVTMALEALLSKERILEIYLNSVEFGIGVFGVEAAAQRYYRKSAARLTPYEAARLAVMLPRPKFYEKTPNSPYLQNRAQTIVVRMADVELP